ncbi:hypothetical protein L3Y34_011780 [Caenorhabditis briggsae]|uniref:Uncharacterized protein n=1 Tax=Caenorhabditis briggsae TaxID=6238 RepID=A0AAE8ZQQ6_CAEBR|nr:hypothetical protein L3Y34_011780 [Caenorhabditis briggsae]
MSTSPTFRALPTSVPEAILNAMNLYLLMNSQVKCQVEVINSGAGGSFSSPGEITSRNVTLQEYHNLLRNESQPYYPTRQNDKILIKLILIEIGKKRKLWARRVYELAGLAVFNQTGKLIRPYSIFMLYRRMRVNLKARLRRAILNKKTPMEIEKILSRWEFHENLKFYRKTLEKWEKSLRNGGSDTSEDGENLEDEDGTEEMDFSCETVENQGIVASEAEDSLRGLLELRKK